MIPTLKLKLSKQKTKFKKWFDWKVKLVLVLIVCLIGGVSFLFMERNNGETTIKNIWRCMGKGDALNRDWEYSPIFNECVTLRVNADGTVTPVFASLDFGFDGSSTE